MAAHPPDEAFFPANGARGVAFRPGELQELSKHVVNLRNGRLSTGGEFQTSESDIERILVEDALGWWEENKDKWDAFRIVLYAHGGLVNENRGMRTALKHLSWWKKNGVYPIYFSWETGIGETLVQLLGRGRARTSRELARGPILDRTLER